MPRVVGYDIAKNSHIEELCDLVQSQIDDGWEPYGPLIVSPTGVYLQTMLKLAAAPKRPLNPTAEFTPVRPEAS